MRFHRGYLIVGRIGDAPLRIHFSWPLGALVLTRFSFRPWVWLVIAALTVVHERGHAYLVKRYRLRVTSIDMHAFGGECRYEGQPTSYQVAVIAWGGVLAQALLLPLGIALVAFGPTALEPLAYGLTWMNLGMIVFNLMPIPPLDGSQAWRLPAIWLAKRRELREHIAAREKERKAKAAARQRQELRVAAAQLDAEGELERLRQLDETDVELPESIREQLRDAMARAHDRDDRSTPQG